jgi:hypothetical protein
MKLLCQKMLIRSALAFAIAATSAATLAQESPMPAPPGGGHPGQDISADAQAVIDRMTATLQGLDKFSIRAQASRDELLPYGYKLQNNESAELTVDRPNHLRSEIRGDIRDRTIVFNNGELTMYSGDDNAFVRVTTPPTLDRLLGGLLDAGIELPLIDVLYQATAGTLTEGVRSGVLIGSSTIGGVACYQLAFRQANIDWQIWVQKGDMALPRKILITTRYEVGDPQFQVVLDWNLKPTISARTFRFDPPEGALEIPLAAAETLNDESP